MVRRTVRVDNSTWRRPAVIFRVSTTGSVARKLRPTTVKSGAATVSWLAGEASRTVSTTSNAPPEVGVAVSRMPGSRPPGPGGRFRSGELPGTLVAVRVGSGVAVVREDADRLGDV